MLLPTMLVGSYAQPEWLIDRAKLAGRFPPRVRAKELWRIPEPYLAEAQNDATVLAIKAQEEAGLDIITDGEIRRESYSNRFATALEGIDIDQPGVALDRSGHPNPVPRIVGKIRRKHAVEVDDLKFLRAHTVRKVKMTVPGPFTMSQQAQNDYYPNLAEAASAYAEAVNAEIKDLFAAGADIVQIDEPYMQARPGPAKEYGLSALNRALEGVNGLTAVHICFGYAAIIHERPSAYSFLPELKGCRCRQISIETAQSNLGLRGAQGIAGPDDHPRRARPVDAGDRNAGDGRRAHSPRARLPQARGHHCRSGLRPQISAARSSFRQDEGDGRRRAHRESGTGGGVSTAFNGSAAARPRRASKRAQICGPISQLKCSALKM